ncbi:thiamine phosphate synthase [Oleiagrimonas sp. C23AA]|uniref:thiamine phosphate synthase n=1 Tax=Oleiagrimonas sp. C23AA TaxID=2719047 RepID=UPI001423FFAC|nr:thiamine phosphate synthase [Oleiagrimonas sp. C23AA]NII12271.1 thiamine phosphate synthase [Oleiagrimonas sp. C23AA]
MSYRKRPLQRGLYAITNGPRPDLLERVDAVLTGGAKLLQYRDTTQEHTRRAAEAKAIGELCRRHQVPFLIERDITLARRVQADGVHLGPDDDSVSYARQTLGPEALIGAACVDDFERACRAVGEGVDYISFGVFFPSPTVPHAKPVSPDLLGRAATLDVMRVAIGGITPDNGAPLVAAGADMLASISTLFDAEDPRATAHRFSQLFA